MDYNGGGGGYSGYTTITGQAIGSTGYWTDSNSRCNYFESTPPKPKSLMNTVISDIKSFIKEHRSIVYSIVIILLVDHFFLDNKLTGRVKAMVEKLLGIVEKKVESVAGTASATPASPPNTTS